MPLAEVVFEVAATGALGRFTREHPEAKAVVRFVSLGPEGARVLVTLAGPTALTASLVRSLQEELAGDEFQVLSITPYSVVLKASVAPERGIWTAPALRLVEVFGRDTIVEPALVQQGVLRLRGVAPQQLDTRRALEKLQELQRLGGWDGFRVVRVGELDPKALVDRSAGLLDAEQEELVRLALLMGYYDTPRRCNLEDIAGRVGLSVSPVHKKLKEVEHTLIHAHLEPDAKPVPRRRRAGRRAAPAGPGGLLREVVVRLGVPGFGVAEFTRQRAGARVVYQPLGEEPGTVAHLFVVLGRPDDAAAFLKVVEADPGLVDYEVLSRDLEHLSLKVRRKRPSAAAPPSARTAGLGADPLQNLAAALGRDAYLKPSLCEGGTVLGRIVVTRRLGEEELEAMLQELALAGGWDPAELVSVRDAGLESALAAARPRGERMTGRQEEVLRIAHALGYYRTPRECTLEDIAATLGISANAVHKSLTAAEQRIIQGYVGGGL